MDRRGWMRCGDRGLFGSREGVEGHGVSLVADGVEAKLEACGGAFDGHGVELVLLVARDAGVVGIVGVGLPAASAAVREP